MKRYIKYFSLIFLLAANCESCCEFCLPICADSAEYQIKVRSLGNVTMTDGEICKVEEFYKFFQNASYSACYANVSYLVDTKKDCRNISCESRPLVRRIVCPSGKNGTSKVDTDGTKFQNEIIQ